MYMYLKVIRYWNYFEGGMELMKEPTSGELLLASPFTLGVCSSVEPGPLLMACTPSLGVSPFTPTAMVAGTVFSLAPCDKLLLLFLVCETAAPSVDSTELCSFGTLLGLLPDPATGSEATLSAEVLSTVAPLALMAELEKGVLGEAMLLCEDPDSEFCSLW